MPTTHQKPISITETSRYTRMLNRPVVRTEKYIPHRAAKFVPGFSRGTFQMFQTLQREAEEEQARRLKEEALKAEKERGCDMKHPSKHGFTSNCGGVAWGSDHGFTFNVHVSNASLNTTSSGSAHGSVMHLASKTYSLKNLKHP